MSKEIPFFATWIAAELGTHKWFVGRWTARLRMQYDVRLSQSRYLKLCEKYKKTFGVPCHYRGAKV